MSVAPARIGWLLPLLIAVISSPSRADDKVLLLAGSASKPVLETAAEMIHDQLGITVELSYGGSGAVLSQLELAGRGDIYLPGSHDWLLRAAGRGLVDLDTRVDFAYLIPALVVARGNPKKVLGVTDLVREDLRIAIAEPRTVCVGEYAVAILSRVGLEAQVLDRSGRVRSCAALADLAAIGSVDVIVGWRVFARWYPESLEAIPLPPEIVTRVATIPGAITSAVRNRPASEKVLAWLSGPEGRKLWHDAGYLTDLAEVKRLAPRAEIGN